VRAAGGTRELVRQAYPRGFEGLGDGGGGGQDKADGGAQRYVIAPPPGELFSETNDNSVAVLLSYGTARVLLAGDAEVGEEYMASGAFRRS
jgi:hypothetical protein